MPVRSVQNSLSLLCSLGCTNMWNSDSSSPVEVFKSTAGNSTAHQITQMTCNYQWWRRIWHLISMSNLTLFDKHTQGNLRGWMQDTPGAFLTLRNPSVCGWLIAWTQDMEGGLGLSLWTLTLPSYIRNFALHICTLCPSVQMWTGYILCTTQVFWALGNAAMD